MSISSGLLLVNHSKDSKGRKRGREGGRGRETERKHEQVSTLNWVEVRKFWFLCPFYLSMGILDTWLLLFRLNFIISRKKLD